MRFKLCVIVVVAAILSSCGNSGDSTKGQASTLADTSARIEITINGLQPGKVMLYRHYGTNLAHYRMDSVQAQANTPIVFERNSLFPPGMYYVVTEDLRFFGFLLDKDQTIDMHTHYDDMMGKMEVNNCLDNELYYKDLEFEASFRPRMKIVQDSLKLFEYGTPEYQRVFQRIEKLAAKRKEHIQWFVDNHPNSFFTEFKMTGQNPEVAQLFKPDGSIDTSARAYRYRNEFFDNTPMNSDRLLHTPVLGNKLKKYLDELIPFDRDSAIHYIDKVVKMTDGSKECFKYVVNQAAIKFKDPTFLGGDSVFVYLVDNYFTEEKAWWEKPEELKEIKRIADERRPSMIGKPAQDLRAPTLDGSYISLLDTEEPLIVLYIYSTTCDHCRERTPALRRVYSQWKDKGVSFFTLCTETDKEQWINFVQEFGIRRMRNVYDPKYETEFYKKYHTDVTPECYVINRPRKIVAKDLHPDDLPGIFHKHLADR